MVLRKPTLQLHDLQSGNVFVAPGSRRRDVVIFL